MAGSTDYSAKAFLEWLVGKTAMPTLATVDVALFTAVGLDDGTGFTEVTGGSYVRKSTVGADWNAASGSAPSLITNANAVIFVPATASWGTVIGWGLYSGSNFKEWDYLGAFDWLEFSCTSASPGVLTVPAHGYSNGDQVVVDAEFGGVALPPTSGSWSGLLTVANVTTNTFTAGVNTTGVGGGMVRKVTSQAIPSGATFQFLAGQITLRVS
jgi:hypothetical protein